jgi:hypothetical protein
MFFSLDQQQQAMVENIRSSSHSSFNSDEQSIFFPSYSSNATSQIYSTNTSITTTNAKPHIPNSLSLTNNRLSSSSLVQNSTNDSPIENEINEGISSNSFFTNEHTGK